MPKASGEIWKAATAIEINCADCGVSMLRTGRRHIVCKACSKKRGAKRSYVLAVKRGKITNPGVGTGRAQGFGVNHHSWRQDSSSGYRVFRKDFCERCGSTKFLCAHHRDHNRANNEQSNIETLCKSCHQKEHGAADHLNRPRQNHN